MLNIFKQLLGNELIQNSHKFSQVSQLVKSVTDVHLRELCQVLSTHINTLTFEQVLQ
jgi:hypothetical protein